MRDVAISWKRNVACVHAPAHSPVAARPLGEASIGCVHEHRIVIASEAWQSRGREDGRNVHGRYTSSVGDFSTAFGINPSLRSK